MHSSAVMPRTNLEKWELQEVLGWIMSRGGYSDLDAWIQRAHSDYCRRITGDEYRLSHYDLSVGGAFMSFGAMKIIGGTVSSCELCFTKKRITPGFFQSTHDPEMDELMLTILGCVRLRFIGIEKTKTCYSDTRAKRYLVEDATGASRVVIISSTTRSNPEINFRWETSDLPEVNPHLQMHPDGILPQMPAEGWDAAEPTKEDFEEFFRKLEKKSESKVSNP